MAIPLKVALTATLFLASLLPAAARAQTIDPVFAADYSLLDLGSVTDLPAPYGGLFILADEPDSLYIGGTANNAAGALYRVGLVRDGDGHITGLAGAAVEVAPAPYNDGGIVPDPGGLISYALWPSNAYGQIDLASGELVNQIDLVPFGVVSSSSMVAFIPAGFPGAGGMRIASWSGGEFYEVGFTVGAGGIIDITDVTAVPGSTLPGGPEGWAYVPQGSPQFSTPSMIVSEYSADNVSVYELDDAGNPVVATRRTFISDLAGAEGASIDPVSGDYLFSTFSVDGGQVIAVEGFVPPPVAAGDLTPASVDFGDVAVGSSSPTEVLTLASTGTAPLEVTNATLSGTYYEASSTCPIGSSGLAPGTSCTIAITCVPAAVGAQAGSYVVATNAGIFSTTLQCNGVAAPAPGGTLAPANVDFGDVLVGSTTGGNILTITSTGTVALEIASEDVVGSYFNASSACPIGSPGLAPGDTCSIEISCLPIAVGPQSGSYTATTNAGVLTTSLQCNGVAAPVAEGSLTPANVDFGDVVVGSSSAAQVLTIASIGTVALEIASANLTGDYFSANSNCPAGSPGLAPGTSCTIEITCTPTAVGAQAGSYTFDTNGGVLASTLQCNGLSVGPAPPLTPVPIHSGWMLVALGTLLAIAAIGPSRRRRRSLH